MVRKSIVSGGLLLLITVTALWSARPVTSQQPRPIRTPRPVTSFTSQSVGSIVTGFLLAFTAEGDTTPPPAPPCTIDRTDAHFGFELRYRYLVDVASGETVMVQPDSQTNPRYPALCYAGADDIGNVFAYDPAGNIYHLSGKSVEGVHVYSLPEFAFLSPGIWLLGGEVPYVYEEGTPTATPILAGDGEGLSEEPLRNYQQINVRILPPAQPFLMETEGVLIVGGFKPDENVKAVGVDGASAIVSEFDFTVDADGSVLLAANSTAGTLFGLYGDQGSIVPLSRYAETVMMLGEFKFFFSEDAETSADDVFYDLFWSEERSNIGDSCPAYELTRLLAGGEGGMQDFEAELPALHAQPNAESAVINQEAGNAFRIVGGPACNQTIWWWVETENGAQGWLDSGIELSNLIPD